MTTSFNSIPPLDKEAALNWLRNAGEVETTITVLAEKWGWERTRASRALKGWEGAGLITRRSGSEGRAVITAVVPPVHGSSPAVHTVAQQSEGTAAISAGPAALAVHASIPAAHAVAPTGGISGGPAALSVQATCKAVRTVAQPNARSTRQLRSLNVLSAAMVFVAFCLGSVGLFMNAKFAASFGQSAWDRAALAVLGVMIDLLALMLPSVGARLFRSGRRVTGTGAWLLWPVVTGVSVLAGTGFGAANIGHTIADRDRAVHEIVGVRATVDRLRAERTASTEIRSTALLQAQSELERALIDRGVWKATSGCHDVTISDSAAACSAIMATRRAMAAAARRDAVDAELRAAEEKLATFPAMQSATDPQVEMVADIVAWITKVSFQPQDIARIRVIVLALMPTLSGIVLGLGMALRREAEQRTAVERAFVAQQGDSACRTVPEKSAQRSVSVRKGSRSAVEAASDAQWELPLGGPHDQAA
jgi:hypothetical protein